MLIGSGYDEAMIPERYAPVRRCEKPVAPRTLPAMPDTVYADMVPVPSVAPHG